MSAALGAASVATQAAATAFSTAKDVFHTLQYVPPTNNTWTPPPNSQWTPKQSPWSPPPTAADEEWTPAEDTSPREPLVHRDSEEMTQLLEMGFANRELNKKLLEKYSYDLEKVIQELVTGEENDWHARRH